MTPREFADQSQGGYRLLGLLIGCYALIGGATSFMGWAFDVRRLTDWIDNGISIQPNAAVCVTLSGLALMLLATGGERSLRLARWLGFPVLLIGGLTLLQWVTGLRLGIDSLLLFGREWGRVGVIYPGRMGPPGSFSWTLIGIALALASRPRDSLPPDRRSPRRFVPLIALAVGTLMLFSVTGYLFGAQQFYSISWLTVIALQTATFILAICIGLIVSVPEHQPMLVLREKSAAGMFARFALPALVLLPIIISLLRGAGQNLGYYDEGTGRALAVIANIVVTVGLMWWALSAVRRGESRIERQADQLRLVTDAMPALVSYIDARGIYRFANRAYHDWFGHDPTGLHMRDVLGEAAYEKLRSRVESALAGRREEFEAEVTYKGAGLRHIHANYVPDFASSGAVDGFYVMVSDVSQRIKADEAAARLAAIVTSSDDAIVSKTLEGVITSWNHGAESLFGYSAAEAVGQPITMLIPPDRHDEEHRILERIRHGQPVGQYETIRRRKDGSLVDVSLSVSPIVDASGLVVGAAKIARDITERKKQEETLKLMARELSHRVKNTLATIKSIAAQTLRRSTTLAEFESAFNGRITSLAGVHGLLTQSNWGGASIREVIFVALSPYPQWHAGAIGTDAQDLMLTDRQALGVSMMLHELATNALKHGGLSLPAGIVTINAREEQGQAILEWIERGGPSVGEPAKRGMGLTLIERITSFELGGQARCTFEPAGFSCRIAFPLKQTTSEIHAEQVGFNA